MNQLKKLTWKYFLQQKWRESREPLTVISIIVGIFFSVFGWVFYSEFGYKCLKIIGIIGLIILGFWILLGIYQLIKLFFKWINSNWQKATERAINELSDEQLDKELGLE